jgi:hypothetical protein
LLLLQLYIDLALVFVVQMPMWRLHFTKQGMYIFLPAKVSHF